MSFSSVSRIASNESSRLGRHSSKRRSAFRSLHDPGAWELASVSASRLLAISVISSMIRLRTTACPTWNPCSPKSSTNAVTSFASCSRLINKNSRIWLCSSAIRASKSMMAEPVPSSMVNSTGFESTISGSTIPSCSNGGGSSGSSRTSVSSSTSTESMDA